MLCDELDYVGSSPQFTGHVSTVIYCVFYVFGALRNVTTQQDWTSWQIDLQHDFKEYGLMLDTKNIILLMVHDQCWHKS